MKCEQCLQQLSAFQDGELPRQAADELQQHLEQCSACAAQAERLAQALAAVDALPLLAPSEGFDAALAHKLEQAAAAAPSQQRRPSWWGYISWLWQRPALTVVAAGSCAALLAVVLLRDPPPPPNDRSVPEMELAKNLPLLRDYDLVARLETLQQVSEQEGDFDVVAHLDELTEEEL